jgi:hypothetical protein
MHKNVAAERGNLADSINTDLINWFAEHGCAWSGTVSELLSALVASSTVSHSTLPSSANALFAHLRTYGQALESLGMEVTLNQSCPRMVSLRPTPRKGREKPLPVVNQPLPVVNQPLDRGLPAGNEEPSNVSRKNVPTDRETLTNEVDRKAPTPDAMDVLLAISDMQKQVKARLKESDTGGTGISTSDVRNNAASCLPARAIAKERMGDAFVMISAVEERIAKLLQASGPSQSIAPPQSTVANDIAPAHQVTADKRAGTDRRTALDSPTPGARLPMLPSDSPDVFENTLPFSIDCSDSHSEPIFENTGQALLRVIEVQEQLKTLRPEKRSVIDLAAAKTQEMSKATGLAIALARDGRMLYRAETGLAREFVELQCGSNLMRSCLETGKTLELQSSGGSPVGEWCLPEGIKSLIISPFAVGGGLVGAIEFVFQERRSLQKADVITIRVIAETVAAALM